MTPKLLSPEDLEAELSFAERQYPGAAKAIRAHIAALEAATAALIEALEDVAEADPATEHGKAAHRRAYDLSEQPHPGATLLSEHAKALVRARNEGREEVARHMENLGDTHEARRIRAMKETEG